jgi:hypothetical protein
VKAAVAVVGEVGAMAEAAAAVTVSVVEAEVKRDAIES